MKKRSIITGAAGFIGSHMADLLHKKNHKIILIDNLISGSEKNIKHLFNKSNVDFIKIDINDLKHDDKIFNDCDYVFHLAGIGDIVPSIEMPIKYFNTNVLGTINMLECSRKNNIKKFIYAASSSCYGVAKTPTDENHPIELKYPYALSKYQGEQAAFHWFNVYKLPVNSIRIFNAYGTRSRTSGAYGAVIGTFLKQKISNKSFTVVGDGTQKRDFIYVTDLVRAFLKAAEKEIHGEVFNIGSGNPRSILELTQILQGNIELIPKRPGEPDITHAKIDKAKNLLNWEPKISFEEGLERILDNIDYWNAAPLWTSEKISKETATWFKYLS